MPLLKIDDLHTRFESDRGSVRAVDGVSLQIEEGETLALVGESGSGKSVLSLSIMGLVPEPGRIVGGQIEFAGQDLLCLDESERRALRAREIAMIFQDPMTSLNPVIRVGDQIAESLRLHEGLSRREARDRSVGLLTQVGIPDPAERYRAHPHQLSGGMRQRVMIAIAIACSPRLLIADEPTTALDVTVQAQILDLLRSLQKERGMAMLFVTHDLGVVAEIADRVAVLYAGEVVEEAPAHAIFSAPRMPYTAGLLSSVPRLEGGARRLSSIPGQVPLGTERSQGCRFAPRCEHRDAACLDSQSLEETSGGHRVRCHRWSQIDLGQTVPN